MICWMPMVMEKFLTMIFIRVLGLKFILEKLFILGKIYRN